MATILKFEIRLFRRLFTILLYCTFLSVVLRISEPAELSRSRTIAHTSTGIATVNNDVLEADLLLSRLNAEQTSRERNSLDAVCRDKQTASWKAHKQAKNNSYPSIMPSYPGIQRVDFDRLQLSLKECNLNHSFVTGGERAYEIATMRGCFLKRGILWGDEAGVWSQPYKMLDGVLLQFVNEEGQVWTLNDCKEFTNYLVDVEYTHRQAGLVIKRRDFVPVDQPAIFYTVTVSNPSTRSRTGTLRFTFQENIRPMWQKPWSMSYGEDSISVTEDQVFVARDKCIRGVEVAFGPLQSVKRVKIDDHNPYRMRGVSECEVALAAGETATFEFLAVMLDQRKAPYLGVPQTSSVCDYYELLRERKADLYTNKEKLYREKVTRGVQFTCPDKNLQRAFYSAKHSLQLLTVDARPYLYDKHLMTSPERGYQLLFGIDTLYPAVGAAITGHDEIARRTFNNHLHYAKEIDNIGINFIVDHWGNPQGVGRAQETFQFIGTLWEWAKVTGDYEFCTKHYEQIRALLDNQLRNSRNGDIWPEGMTFPSLSQHSGADAMISAAVRLCWAVDSMAQLAETLDEQQDAHRYRVLSTRLRSKFNFDWWSAERSMWSLGLMQTKETVEHVFWNNYRIRSLHYPQKYLVADYDKGTRALRVIVDNAVDKRGGFHAPAVTPWQNCLLAISCFQYDMADEGLCLLRNASLNPTRLEKMLGVFSSMNDITRKYGKNSNKFLYSWSSGPYLEAVISGLLGIRGNAFTSTLDFHPAIPRDWQNAELLQYRLGKNRLDFCLRDQVWEVSHRHGTQVIHVAYQQNGKTMRKELHPGSEIRLPRSINLAVKDAKQGVSLADQT